MDEALTLNFAKSFAFMFVLLNPFLMSIYLQDLLQSLSTAEFLKVLTRGSIISFVVFMLFAWSGDKLFENVLQVRYASFLIFGGIIFLIIGLRFLFNGSEALSNMRGPAEYMAGSIAMPFMIGPGTVSGSVLVGTRLPLPLAALCIFATLFAVVLGLGILKLLYDYLQNRNERLFKRYIDVVGRISALIIGTIAIEMILVGIDKWFLADLLQKTFK